MADFNQDNPPLRITNPEADKAGLGKGFQPYPAHMHKLGTAPDGGPLYIVVHNDEEREKAAAAGWSDRPDGANEPTGVHPSRANVSELLAEIERLREKIIADASQYASERHVPYESPNTITLESVAAGNVPPTMVEIPPKSNK